LRQHKELIPFKGVLGGIPDYSHLKYAYKSGNHEGYVVISVDDGHIGADMLFFYTIAKDDSIRWELIAYSKGESFDRPEEWTIK